MINPFSWVAQAPNDMSVGFLYRIFGSVNGLLCDSSSAANCSSTTGVTLNVLGTMFKAFNGVVLAIGALIIVYVTVVGVLKTAQEGEFMGKHWNSLFVPIRIVLGIGMLVPTTSGYSGIQIVIMWVIVQGIGAADYIWNTALAATYVLGSPYSQVTLPGAQVSQSVRGIFQGLVCHETAAISDAPMGANLQVAPFYCASHSGDDFCIDNATTAGSASYQVQGNTVMFGPNGYCGSVTLCDQAKLCNYDSTQSMIDFFSTNYYSTADARITITQSQKLKCVACQQQWQAITGSTTPPNGNLTIPVGAASQSASIISTLQPIARAFARGDADYRRFSSPSLATSPEIKWITSYCQQNNISAVDCVYGKKITFAPNDNPDKGAGVQGASTASTQFIWDHYPDLGPKLAPNGTQSDFIGASVGEYLAILQKAASTLIDEQMNKAKNGGQIITGINNSQGWIMAGSYYFTLAQTSNTTLTDTMPSLSGNPMDSSSMSGYRNNAQAALMLASAAAGTSSQSAAFTSDNGLSPLGDAINDSKQAIAKIGVQMSSGGSQGGQNPLLAIAAIGLVMIGLAGVIFEVFVGVTIGLSMLGNLNIFVLGTGVNNPVGPTVTTVYLLLVPIIMGVLGWLISIGSLLGIYTPLIPYIIFTMGTIGWLTSTLEAMIAGPLVALGVMSPSGQHEVLGKAEPAVMLLLNIFLRPTLMIFGMIAAMVLAPVVMTMLQTGYWGVVNQISPGWAMPVNILGIILWISAYVTLVLTALNKVFAVIHIIPEKVMRWISGQPGESYGEGEALGEQKRGVEGAGGSAAAGMAKGRESEGAESKSREATRAREEKLGMHGSGPQLKKGDTPPPEEKP